MPRRLAPGSLAALFFLTAAAAQAQPRGAGREDADPARHGWRSSLAAGQAAARQTGKPLMVVLRCVP